MTKQEDTKQEDATPQDAAPQDPAQTEPEAPAEEAVNWEATAADYRLILEALGYDVEAEVARITRGGTYEPRVQKQEAQPRPSTRSATNERANPKEPSDEAILAMVREANRRIAGHYTQEQRQ